MPEISIVIATYNRGGILLGALDALAGQTLEDDELEVIVVDDGSTDDTVELASQWMHRRRSGNFRLLSAGPHRGKSAACNIGVGASSSPYILFTDDDCLPDPDWARHHLERQRASLFPTGVLGSVSFPKEWVEHSNFVRYLQGRYVGNRPWSTVKGSPDDLPPNMMGGLNVSYPRQSLSAAGLFKEGLDRGQDTELAYRLWKTGLKLVFEPRAKVIHASPDVESLETWLSKYLVLYERDIFLINKMHPEYGERFGHWFLFAPRPFQESLSRTLGKALLRAICRPFLAERIKGYLVRTDRDPRWGHPRLFLYVVTTLALEKIKGFQDSDFGT